MKRFFLSLALLSFLTISCDPDNPKITPPPEKPAPEASVKVKIKVDADYDLHETTAYSILDSISMSSDEADLFVPKEFRSLAVFLDPNSSEIMAVIRTDGLTPELEVNATTVSKTLLDLLPAYHELSPLLQQEFELSVANSNAFKALVTIVDKLIKGKKPVYSTDGDYLIQLLELNRLIQRDYLNMENTGGRTMEGRPSDINSWLSRDDNLIENQVHSFVQVTLTPPDPSQAVAVTLDVRPFTFGQSTKPVNEFVDDYYNINFSQATEEIRNQNSAEATIKFVSLLMDALFGGASSTAGCATKITDGIAAEMTALLAGAAIHKHSEKDVLIDMFNIAGTSVKTAFTEKSCLQSIAGKAVAKILLSKLNVFIGAFNLAWTATDMIQMLGFVKAFIAPVDLSESIQIYKGKLVTGQVSMIAKRALEAEYNPKDIIPVAIEINPDTYYSEIEKQNFDVNWILEGGNGTVNYTDLPTNFSGIAEIQWTMPELGNKTAKLIAEIRDKEGDHIAGSPVTFSTNVKEVLPDNYIKLPDGEILVFTLRSGGCTTQHDIDNPSDFWYDTESEAESEEFTEYINIFFSDHGLDTQPENGTYASNESSKGSISFAHHHFSSTEDYALDGSFTLTKDPETNTTTFEFQGTRVDNCGEEVCPSHEFVTGRANIPCPPITIRQD